ncbi:MAG: hypothetical protein J4478_04670 [Candidatus Diapherotrites archaeon]|uniref:Uncharacterized protein n=1 Tax=Candidatus Iainarchaeum sp. TaxID=3101447 RepID=A0A7J4JVF0_9ARCH|nr:MAG: hypothetical protein QT12_C0006G0004 [archaeon GW2011_AR21]MBS3058663.1 hypothetical protein [Candidatus Diapherotrites archaeon]HIH21752.1 hypothetical protein [Candidatus Diapherotrites archaeon]
MNSKGVFSVIVAASLVLLFATIGFTYYSAGLSQKAMIEQQDTLELRQHWSKMRFLLDKAVVDAIFDYSDPTCDTTPRDVSGPSLQSTLQTYFDNTLNSSSDVFSCTVSGLQVRTTPNFKIDFTLKCEKNSILYSSAISFEKEFRISASAPCQIWDLQGNYLELEYPP